MSSITQSVHKKSFITDSIQSQVAMEDAGSRVGSSSQSKTWSYRHHRVRAKHTRQVSKLTAECTRTAEFFCNVDKWDQSLELHMITSSIYVYLFTSGIKEVIKTFLTCVLRSKLKKKINVLISDVYVHIAWGSRNSVQSLQNNRYM